MPGSVIKFTARCVLSGFFDEFFDLLWAGVGL
jgi:hypothetical protein